ncbi:hypothetical protein TrST_g11591 [Triparma strigata]|uniref:3'-5' exonuclease domain-containing protein n=1 Tax=Triparma strigata TaxID=1606541 RepID=A0A9W6ZJE7_9STRA|nr:hypothetical protein TrST_g11591 [Triparma strigata]
MSSFNATAGSKSSKKGPIPPKTSRQCSECKQTLPRLRFSVSQWKRLANKGASCTQCIDKRLGRGSAATNGAPQASSSSSSSSSDLHMIEDLMTSLNVRMHVVENYIYNASDPVSIQKMERSNAAYADLMNDLLLQERPGGSVSFVGVDCEGTDSQKFDHLPNKAGCMMVQIASPNVVVVECITSKRGSGGGKGAGLSHLLRCLLQDPRLTKSFCDQSGDVRALNAEMDLAEVIDLSPPPEYGAGGKVANISDVQTLSSMKGFKQKRAGLAQVISFATCLPFKKQNFKKNAWWRLKTVEEMVNARGFLQYAAADAWGTFLAEFYLRNEVPKKGGGTTLEALTRDIQLVQSGRYVYSSEVGSEGGNKETS